MMDRVLPFAARYDMFPADGTILAAVSGGMDSMCLLHFLLHCGFSVAAAHFNHRLRGEEADGDEAFVRTWCEENGVSIYVGSGDVRAAAAAHGWSIEEAARKLRYDFLMQTAQQQGFSRIVTAHHANDNAETLLHHLARGTALRGLGGIAPRRGKIVRPLLTTTRDELAAYASAFSIPYRTDSTNADMALTRNYLRSSVVPGLAHINADAVEHISETALRLREEDAYLDELAAERLSALTVRENSVSLPLVCLTQAPPVLQSRMLRLLLDRLGSGKKDFSAVHYAALSELAQGRGAASLDLPMTVRAIRSKDRLRLERRTVTKPESAVLQEDSTVYWGEYTIYLQKSTEDRENSQDTIILSYDKITDVLRVDSWNSSDRLKLPGSRGARSLKRLFRDAGVTERDTVPVIRCGEAPVAVAGLGTDERFLPGAGDRTVVLQIKKITYHDKREDQHHGKEHA